MVACLYIDDERPCPEGWVVARTFEDAVVAVTTQDWDEIAFDHDLGDPAPAKTGYKIATILADEVLAGRRKLPRCSIHTANPIGWKRIYAVLKEIGAMP